MKFAFAVLFSLAFSGLVAANEHYMSLYDNVDVDVILNSERLFNQYMGCIFENGSCTADARNLKREWNILCILVILIKFGRAGVFYLDIFIVTLSITAFFLSNTENITFA